VPWPLVAAALLVALVGAYYWLRLGQDQEAVRDEPGLDVEPSARPSASIASPEASSAASLAEPGALAPTPEPPERAALVRGERAAWIDVRRHEADGHDPTERSPAGLDPDGAAVGPPHDLAELDPHDAAEWLGSPLGPVASGHGHLADACASPDAHARAHTQTCPHTRACAHAHACAHADPCAHAEAHGEPRRDLS
jgi:ABC-type nickel/cobalt efflux system permease component RcnA